MRFGLGWPDKAWRRRFVLGAAAAAMALMPQIARAQYASERFSAIVVDAATGNVLSAMEPDTPRYPASLTKMMTIYMLFEALRDHRITLDDEIPVSAHAASMEPTKLGLVPGSRLTVEQAILGMVTKSANDAAAAAGEFLGGDEARFAQMMTLRAHALGMTHTVFDNASGLPDPDQVTTARDMAILARHLIRDFPEEYRYFSTPSFVWHGRPIPNHDSMLKIYPGADGLKTGYIRASGHNLVTSAMRGNVRLIGVVLGAGSNPERDRDMIAQLDAGFTTMGVAPVLLARQQAPARMPSLIATAHAASLPLAHGATVRLATARGAARTVAVHAKAETRPQPVAHPTRVAQHHPAPRAAAPHVRGTHPARATASVRAASHAACKRGQDCATHVAHQQRGTEHRQMAASKTRGSDRREVASSR